MVLPELKWEEIGNLVRAKVFGGWLIDRAGVESGVEIPRFLPDPDYLWLTEHCPSQSGNGSQDLTDAVGLARDAIRLLENQVCEHEETERQGFNWEVCRACGKKWADDEGGRKPDPLLAKVEVLYDRLAVLEIK